MNREHFLHSRSYVIQMLRSSRKVNSDRELSSCNLQQSWRSRTQLFVLDKLFDSQSRRHYHQS